jgi:hypothetical protein
VLVGKKSTFYRQGLHQQRRRAVSTPRRMSGTRIRRVSDFPAREAASASRRGLPVDETAHSAQIEMKMTYKCELKARRTE